MLIFWCANYILFHTKFVCDWFLLNYNIWQKPNEVNQQNPTYIIQPIQYQRRDWKKNFCKMTVGLRTVEIIMKLSHGLYSSVIKNEQNKCYGWSYSTKHITRALNVHNTYLWTSWGTIFHNVVVHNDFCCHDYMFSTLNAFKPVDKDILSMLIIIILIKMVTHKGEGTNVWRSYVGWRQYHNYFMTSKWREGSNGSSL